MNQYYKYNCPVMQGNLIKAYFRLFQCDWKMVTLALGDSLVFKDRSPVNSPVCFKI